MSRKFVDGDLVAAKWPGSQLYFDAVVVSYDSKSSTYQVRFDADGSEVSLRPNFVMNRGVGRSGSRSRSRSRSPARSPGRRPSLRRSPGRPSKSKVPAAASSSPTRNVDLTSESSSIPSVQQSGNRPTRGSHASGVLASDSTPDSIADRPPEQYNLRQRPLAVQDHLKGTVPVVSAEPMKVTGAALVPCCYWNTLKVAAALLGSLMLVSGTLLAPVWAELLCEKKDCDLGYALVILRGAWTLVPKWDIVAVTVGWLLFQHLLAYIPIGKKYSVNRSSPHPFRLNGLFVFVLSMGTLAQITYFFSGYVRHLAMNLVSVYLVLVVSSKLLTVYLGTRQMLLDESSGQRRDWGSIVLDMLLFGGEPQQLSFQPGWKVWLWRTGAVNTAAVLVIKLTRFYSFAHFYPDAVILLVMAQLVFLVDSVAFEEHRLAPGTFLHQGIGFLTIGPALLFDPFMLTAPIQNPGLPKTGGDIYCHLVLLLISVGLTGYSRWLCNQRAVHINSTGLRFCTTQLWGVVRYPDHLLHFLIVCMWTAFWGWTFTLPFILPTVWLIRVAICARMEAATNEKLYAAEWAEYKLRVRYSFIPGLY